VNQAIPVIFQDYHLSKEVLIAAAVLKKKELNNEAGR